MFYSPSIAMLLAGDPYLRTVAAADEIYRAGLQYCEMHKTLCRMSARPLKGFPFRSQERRFTYISASACTYIL